MVTKVGERARQASKGNERKMGSESLPVREVTLKINEVQVQEVCA